MAVKTTTRESFYNVYPHRDPICVSHYPNPVTEVTPADIYGTMGLGDQPPAHNVGAVYVHVPFCASVCIFCPFNKMAYQEKNRWSSTWRPSKPKSASMPLLHTVRSPRSAR
ncbi:hypothetical protein ACFTAO_05675 [Paenibacillus rhizoplanae]